MPMYRLLAGGPGSGCRGDNCGRPPTVSKQFQTASGATYTIFKPSKKGIPRRSSGYTKKSKFKGKFQPYDVVNGKLRKTDSVAGFEGRKNRVVGVYNYRYPAGDKYAGHGATIQVHRDFANSRVVVKEVPVDEQNWTGMMRQWTFKNFGTAAGFLNKMFGIREKLPMRKLPADE